jgi:phenylacetate-CoA ligase
MPEALNEAERFPWLTTGARDLLHWLHEHPSAPRYNHHCGDRLGAEGLARVRDFEQELHAAPIGWASANLPPWLAEFTAYCYREVPFYRESGAEPARFVDSPPCSRAELSRAPWAFVPDDLPLDDLLVYNTSGTTGHPLDILSHPETASKYLPLLRAALATRGVTLKGGQDPTADRPRVAIVLVCSQRRTYTYASVSSYLDGAGFTKLNLNPADWRDPADRERFLDACDPEIYTGDPLSFVELARLPLRTHPKALLSTAMQLMPAVRAELETHFGCPVLDLYTMNECGPIAVGGSFGGLTGHALLQHRLYVEILDADGAVCPPGVRGEVTLSGGFNPFIPLLRYRTGDYASLDFAGTLPVLIDLQGRPPVVFAGANGQAINNIDVTGALRGFALPQYSLVQARDGALTLNVLPQTQDHDGLRAALQGLFGAAQPVTIVESEALADGKVVQYRREQ